MSKNKIKPKDSHCINKLDRKQSNKKERQSGFFKTAEELEAWLKSRSYHE